MDINQSDDRTHQQSLAELRHFWEQREANPSEISTATWKQLIKTYQMPKYELQRLFWRWKLEPGEITQEKKGIISHWMVTRASPPTVKQLAEQISLTPFQVSNIIYEISHQGSQHVESVTKQHVRKYLMDHDWDCNADQHISHLLQHTGIGRRQLFTLIRQLEDQRQPMTPQLRKQIQRETSQWWTERSRQECPGTVFPPHQFIAHLSHKTNLTTRQVSRAVRYHLSCRLLSHRKRPILQWIKEHKRLPKKEELSNLQIASGYSRKSISAMISYGLQAKGEITPDKKNFIAKWLQQRDTSLVTKAQMEYLAQKTNLHWQQVKNVTYGIQNPRRKRLTQDDRKAFFSLFERPNTTDQCLEQERMRRNLTSKQLNYLRHSFEEEQSRSSEITKEHKQAIRELMGSNQSTLSSDQIETLLDGKCSNLTRAQIRRAAYNISNEQRHKRPITAIARLKVQNWILEKRDCRTQFTSPKD
eukprot:CAMPEP_0117434890 /NCGR_PEP_ID=MMETSP0759-20121206/187_1 /TAXON_ID=63605 /ORGANISM="Percolomonas cosmopolitus, Strain WS" /LENGTH=472 /DNA_ID=CAMNT_0005226397 /DNA_START=234 /DNA_END=1649 /DNA_ORIENTATION=-